MSDKKSHIHDENTAETGLVSRIARFGARYIDYKMGMAGAIVMTGIVFGVNYQGLHDVSGATTAALKQGTYTFLFGGSIMRGCEYLAARISNPRTALIAAVVIPSAVAICLTFGVHQLKGTPKPVESTIPTAVLVIPSTAVWGYRKRKQSKNGNLHLDFARHKRQRT